MNRRIRIALLALMLAALVYLVPSPALTTEHTLYGACVALAALLAVLALRQLRADLCHAGECQRLLDGSLRDARIAQRNLVPHAAVDGRESLLDAAA